MYIEYWYTSINCARVCAYMQYVCIYVKCLYVDSIRSLIKLRVWISHRNPSSLLWLLFRSDCHVTSRHLLLCRRPDRGVHLRQAGQEAPVQDHQRRAAGPVHARRRQRLWPQHAVRSVMHRLRLIDATLGLMDGVRAWLCLSSTVK